MIKPLQSIKLKNDNGEDTTYVVASAPAIVETTEPASVASFSDGAEGLPVKSLLADINPVQTGSGDPSPTNIRPITGWTGMNVVRTGANLWDEQWEHGYWSSSDGTKGGSSTQFINKNPIPVKPNTTYKVLTWQLRICQYKADGTFISATNVTNTTFTTDAECAYINFNTFNNNYGASDYRGNDIAILYPSTLTTYEPYNGTTYPISWADEAGTVYGGTLDVTTGLLTVTHELKAISEFSWTQYPTNPIVFYTTVSGKAFGVSNIMSDAFSVTGDSIASMTAGTMRGIATQAVVYIAANSTDPTDFVNNYGTNQFLYELATPQTYQLTPQAVTTILGQNNIWADTGDVEVAYCADTKMYIDKVIAAL